jgi:hypothetical protein
MIYLNTGTNSVVVTLYEKSTQLQPYYTWNLTRKGTFDNVTFYQNDISYVPWYWNQFVITIGTVSGLTAGQININSGEYIYTIYEMASPYILATSSAIDMVETGICIVDSQTFSTINSYTGTMNNNISYYKNI